MIIITSSRLYRIHAVKYLGNINIREDYIL